MSKAVSFRSTKRVSKSRVAGEDFLAGDPDGGDVETTSCPESRSGLHNRSGPSSSYASGRIGIGSTMSSLAAKTCVPCRGGTPPLKGEELAALETQVDGWNIIEEHHITKTFKFPDFREALRFVNHVGELAEEQGHHPDISLAWGKVEITTWTHKINGLTESDFILA